MLGASGFPGAIDWATNANGSIGSGWASSDIATSFSASSTQSAQVQFNLETYHLTRIQTAVPEPSTALLAGAALALIGWLSRR